MRNDCLSQLTKKTDRNDRLFSQMSFLSKNDTYVCRASRLYPRIQTKILVLLPEFYLFQGMYGMRLVRVNMRMRPQGFVASARSSCSILIRFSVDVLMLLSLECSNASCPVLRPCHYKTMNTENVSQDIGSELKA